MKKTLIFVLNVLKIYFFGSLTSLIFLFYLVLTDPYFKKLDFGKENYVVKLDEYFLFTFYIPMCGLIAYGLYLLIKNKFWVDKLISLAYVLIGLVLFFVFDLKIKNMLIVSNKIIINIMILFVLYIALISLCIKLKKIIA